MRKSVLVSVISLALFAVVWGQPSTDAAEQRTSQITEGLAESGEKFRQKAQSEKKSGRYQDSSKVKSNGWADRAMDRAGKLFTIPKFDDPAREIPTAPSNPNLFSIAQILVWLVLGGAVVAGLYFALRNINWNKSKKRAVALVEDSEPDRSADEWLQISDKLAKEGRFREALRALYVATLIRLDENRLLKFRKWETNWEHLARFNQNSETYGIDLRPITASFDRFWYGNAQAQMSDVDQFRQAYSEILQKLATSRRTG
jgi:hypothetical protein